MAEVVILGAGLTGLSAAYHLDQLGIAYQLFEKSDRAGGLLKSVQTAGYTFDHTGHFLHVSDEGFKRFLDHTIGLSAFDIIERRSAIFSHTTLTEYPFQMNLHGLPTTVMAECIEGFVKRRQNTADPRSFYTWVLKHFGAGFGKHFFFPYNSKILAYNLKKVHPAWTGRFVPSTNLLNIIEGCFEQKNRTGVGYNSSFYYPKKGGIEAIVRSITRKLAQPIQPEHEVCSIDPATRTVHFSNGQHVTYRKLISTLPLNQLLRIIRQPSSSAVALQASKLVHNSVVNFNLGFNTQLGLDKHWIYFPEGNYPFYRLGFWHNVSASLVPAGHTAVYGEVAYLPHKTKPAEVARMTEQAAEKTLAFLGVGPAHRTVQSTLHIDHAYVIYDAWRQQNLPDLLGSLERMNIHSIGRYGAWKYSSMQEAYQDGRETAIAIQASLGLTKKTPHTRKKGAQRGSTVAAVL